MSAPCAPAPVVESTEPRETAPTLDTPGPCPCRRGSAAEAGWNELQCPYGNLAKGEEFAV
jgi:hypothetical protein